MNNLPNVTVLMLTYGRHKELTEEAIHSFLLQDYENKTLLIINTHPDKIDLSQYKNIIVINEDDIFDIIGQKYFYGIKNFPENTDLWCVLDDDNIILPTHISSLVSGYIEQKQVNSNINCVHNEYRILFHGTEFKGYEHGVTWCQCLYEKPSLEFLRFCEDSVNIPAYDLTILYSKYINGASIKKEEPTFIYRWASGSRHLSGWGGEKLKELMQICRDEANAIKIKEPWNPHWIVDYTNLSKS